MNLPPEGASLDEIERDALEQALDRCGWKQVEAARLLRITPRAINYKIRVVHRLEPPAWVNIKDSPNEMPKKNKRDKEGETEL